MEDRVRKIVDGLILGTANGKFAWQDTERDDEYSLKLSTGMITVDCWDSFDEEIGEPIYLIDIAFLNGVGETVERIVYTQDESADYRKLMELHKIAKRNSLRIDQTLDEILIEIEKKNN